MMRATYIQSKEANLTTIESLYSFIEIFSRLTRTLKPDCAYTQCLDGSTERNIIENVTTLYMNFAKFGYILTLNLSEYYYFF